MATLKFESGQYVFRCEYGQQGPAKAAGFRWDPERKAWWTKDAQKASALMSVADEATVAAIRAAIDGANASIEASRATDADIEIPCPAGLSYLPYQRAGIAYALSRSSSLIGDEMGLGKTIQAIGVLNTLSSDAKIIIVCPASLRLNWAREIGKWSVLTRTIGIVEGSKWPEGAKVVIINYDVLSKHSARLAQDWDLLIVDEAHYAKNPKAQRTKALLGEKGRGGIHAKRRVFLTGTPITNRPIELWPLVQALDPAGLGASWYTFAKRYCAGKETRYGWDVTGSSNLDELQQKLRASIMVRRLKKDVLTELPPKVRQIIEIPANGSAAAVRAEVRAYEVAEARLEGLRVAVEMAKAGGESAYAAAVEALAAGSRAAFTELSKVRHQTALAKVGAVVEHAINGPDKQLIFCHHKDVAEQIADGLREDGHQAVVATGDSSMEERQAAVDAFQGDPAVRFFVGTMGACGVGLTLTAASHVLFAELDWVPGTVSQAEDRAHRIGQRGSVLVQHLVLEGSIDARMAKVLVEKQEVIDEALDRDTSKIEALDAAEIPAERERTISINEPATASVSRATIHRDAAGLTDEQVSTIHEGLRILAGVCDGAHALDGAGFNRLDSAIGKSLAESATLTGPQAAIGRRLLKKYHRQLPVELISIL